MPYARGKKKAKITLRTGFEPVRGDPIGFQVQRLNHSAIAARLDVGTRKEALFTAWLLWRDSQPW